MANKVSDSIAASCKQSRNERIEEFLREHYAFRYNTVKSRAEFRSSDGEFLPVTKYRLNSFRRELDRTIGISTSAENLRSMLESDFSERVNPVQAYFHKLPPATGTQAIDELAATVTVRNALHWSEYLTKWLVGGQSSWSRLQLKSGKRKNCSTMLRYCDNKIKAVIHVKIRYWEFFD